MSSLRVRKLNIGFDLENNLSLYQDFIPDGKIKISGKNNVFIGSFDAVNGLVSLSNLEIKNVGSFNAFNFGVNLGKVFILSSSSENYSIPDVGSDSSFVLTNGNQTLFGTKTFNSLISGSVSGSASSLSTSRLIWGQSFNGSSNVSGNIVGAGTIQLGTQDNKATLSYTSNTQRTLTIPDSGANASFVMTEGNQTLYGTKTFSSVIDGSIIGNAGTVTNGVYTSRSIGTGTGLTGGGNLSADRTLSLTGQALAFHNLSGNGLVVKTGNGTAAVRSIVAGTGISVTNGDGVSSNITITNTFTSPGTNLGIVNSVSSGPIITSSTSSTGIGGMLAQGATIPVASESSFGVINASSEAQSIAGSKKFNNQIQGNINGNAGSVTNGAYTTGTQDIYGNKTFSSNTFVSGRTGVGYNSTEASQRLTVRGHLGSGVNKGVFMGGDFLQKLVPVGIWGYDTGIYIGNSASSPSGVIESTWGREGGPNPQIHIGTPYGFTRYSAFYDGTLRLYPNNDERMRITEFSFLYASSSTSYIYQSNSFRFSTIDGLLLSRSSTSTRYQIEFYNPNNIIANGLVGRISTSGSTTAYQSISDYRLKTNVKKMRGALEKLKKTNPVTWEWKIDGKPGQGFIAHELQEIFPEAVTGSKDAVDDKGKPKYQGVDTSYLIATLVSAIKELKEKIKNSSDELNLLLAQQ